MNALTLYRIGNKYKNNKAISYLIERIIFAVFNSKIPSTCTIGKETNIAYGGIGVVIHSNATIGNNCMIGQGITIGGRNGLKDVPIIKDNVYIGAGARILGDVVIESNVIIGPNAVVTKSITESYTIWGGVPAKLIGRITKENYEKYRDYKIIL